MERKQRNTVIIEILTKAENIKVECSICLTTHEKTKCILTDCNHLFGNECLNAWMNKCRKCPLCRSDCGTTIIYC
jgi:metal-responsive CopG/Arc/MetJ family transcriptional regulator